MSLACKLQKFPVIRALAAGVGLLLLTPQIVHALPGETGSDLINNWRAASHILSRPTAQQKYTDGYPDLSSDGAAAGGRISFSAFLNSNGVSESESIDYRPAACEAEPYRCSGQVIFQKSGNNLGHLLIAEVFGPEVLEDFVRSDELNTINEPGRTRAISHFTVLEKNDAELRNSIRLAETCSNPAMRSDPLCSAP